MIVTCRNENFSGFMYTLQSFFHISGNAQGEFNVFSQSFEERQLAVIAVYNDRELDVCPPTAAFQDYVPIVL